MIVTIEPVKISKVVQPINATEDENNEEFEVMVPNVEEDNLEDFEDIVEDEVIFDEVAAVAATDELHEAVEKCNSSVDKQHDVSFDNLEHLFVSQDLFISQDQHCCCRQQCG